MDNNYRFKKKIKYYKYKMKSNMYLFNNHFNYIEKISKTYNVDSHLLYYILLIEWINRGNWLTKSSEKILVKLFINKVIKYDISIGIGQIKVSTAQFFLRHGDNRNIARNLLIDEFNIEVCAKIISSYYHSIHKSDDKGLLGLVKQYTTGNDSSKVNIQIIIYYSLLKWAFKESLLSKVRLN